MVVRALMLGPILAVVWAFAMPEIPQFRAGFVTVLAMALAAVAIFASASTLARVVRLLHPILILALAAPAVCMALQLVPIPIHGLGNPIWETASTALNEPLAERLTVDIRASLQAIMQYNAVVALALVTAVVALDRQRAAQLLYMLAAVATIVSACSIWRHVNGLEGSSGGAPPLAITNAAVPAALGLLLSAVMILHAYEQIRRARKRSISALGPTTTLLLGLLAMVICLTAILVQSETSIAVSSLLGTGTVFAVFATRKWFYGIWGTAGVLAAAAILFLASFTLVPIRQNADLTVALSRSSHIAAERMLQDVGLAGSGAGAYAVLLPVYRDIGTTASPERPTTAAVIAVEMGRTFLCGLLIVTVLGACILFRRSLLRSQDYAYAAIGSGAAVSLAMLALIDGGILDLGESLLAAVLFGVAFAQSQSSSEIPYARSGQPANGANDQAAMSQPARLSTSGSAPVRLALGSIAVVLMAQSAWLLSERSHLGGSLVGQLAAGDPSIQTVSRLPSNSLEPDGDLGAGDALAATLRVSPLRGDLWLMLAATSREHGSNRYDLTALLKLSYYTAPNDLALVPLRLAVGLGTNSAVNEPELRDLIRRDVKIAVENQPALRSGFGIAYRSATADGRAFADSLISELDPGYLESMHAAVRFPSSGAELPSSGVR
ncbi:hypothetical protein [Bradyrhizobium sp. CCBAU 45384]|uniref:hypothetical protein n=1 Tax=Bradyrhizobium sp. CCBAU 45384 TaxID=858428 RepID=UPI002304E530|nr:hypothetical protein [Bradyrhizobium sp. CCBAU 45384]MDA9409894.1 hypothetical protein [Bradyrhizobium sp. CCBAU 45384]